MEINPICDTLQTQPLVGWVKPTRMHGILGAESAKKRGFHLPHGLLFALAVVQFLATSAAESQARFEETPFLWFGKSYADGSSEVANGLREKYGDIPFDYPTAQSCLSETAQTDGAIESTDLKWAELQSSEVVEVCLFRVLSRLRSVDKITAWMTGQGWERQQLMASSATAFIFGSPGPITQLGFYWDSRKLGEPYGPRYRESRFFSLTRSSTVTVILDNQRGVLSLTIGTSGMWSK
jgi:hypothetical protein